MVFFSGNEFLSLSFYYGFINAQLVSTCMYRYKSKTFKALEVLCFDNCTGLLFFIEIPDFTDVLYAVTALYIAYVLEGERQATFGVSGSFVLGGLLAFWILTVVEQPYQIFILVIPLLALIFSLQPTFF